MSTDNESWKKERCGWPGSTIPFGQTTLQGLRCCTLQPEVVAYPDGVLQAEKLAKFIKQWRGETRVRA